MPLYGKIIKTERTPVARFDGDTRKANGEVTTRKMTDEEMEKYFGGERKKILNSYGEEVKRPIMRNPNGRNNYE